MNNKVFAEKLIDWYNNNKRDLPWRNTGDPFKIWLSEVILQQTRVTQGLPYYQRFIQNYSNIEALAGADEQQVLRLWQGLGYYSRARNLHRCAKVVAEDFKGVFPKRYKDLLKLPGIGKYTAAAIASFAYKESVPVIDGNVYRVLSRVFGIQEDIATGKGQKIFEKWAGEAIHNEKPDIYNQAIMEFGAMHCTPKAPQCSECIFNIECVARAGSLQGKLPVKSRKVTVKNRYFHYLVLRHKDRTVMKKREKDDIWKGLYDYMLVEAEEFKSFDWLMDHDPLRQIHPYIREFKISNDYKHVLTHQRLFARFFTIELQEQIPLHHILKVSGLAWLDEESIFKVPKPVLVTRYLNDTIF